ncbi:MAG: erythromycin esterase family protein [Bacteroidia bacterium]|nr:erythromycin esterase family protein [Bacteroidia bacterium]
MIFRLSLFLFLSIFTLKLGAQTDSIKWQNYVHPLVIKGDSNFISFEPLDEVVPKYSFFFTGEEHRKKINTQLQLNFLLYLHQTAGVKNLIVEGGYSYGFLLNSYVKSGNERILDKALAVAPICPDNMRTMYRRIHQYNKNLPEKDQIRVLGIDLEHSPELALQVLNLQIPNKEFPKAIKKRLKAVKELHKSPYIDDKQVSRMFKRLKKDMEKKEGEYKAFLDNNFSIFEMIVDNTVAGYNFNWLNIALSTKSWKVREDQMYLNFLTIQRELQDGGCYAQFGALHTQLAKGLSWDFPTIARQLNEKGNSPVKGEVMAITRYLRNFQDEYAKWKENDALKDMINYVEKAYPDRVVLCRLTGENSPFKNISKAFQYMIYIDEDLEEIRCK